MIKYMISYWI